MKSASLLVFFSLLLCSVQSFAQPSYSPEVRSKKEIQWMQDSLHVNTTQLNKVSAISLTYQQQMDDAGAGADKKKKQARLMRKKDTEMKAILDKPQYQKYIKREELIRKRNAITYKGHQPM